MLGCPMLDVASTLNADLQEMTRVALRKLSASPAKEGAVESPVIGSVRTANWSDQNSRGRQ